MLHRQIHTYAYVFEYVDITVNSFLEHDSVMTGRLEMLILRHLVLGERVTEAKIDPCAYSTFLSLTRVVCHLTIQ